MPTHTRVAPDFVPLSELCATLQETGLPTPRGGHRALQTLAASAAFPCHKRNGKWFVWRADLPRVAAACAVKSPAERDR
jgi:hypothetical protein